MNIEKLMFLILYFFFLSSCGHLGTKEIMKVSFENEGKEVLLSDAPLGTYKCKVLIKGKLSCDTKTQITMNSKPYKVGAKDFFKKGKINSSVFEGDWYGDELGINFMPQGQDCFENEIEVTVIYYH